MTTSEINRAIAELCGWTIHQLTVGEHSDVAILPPDVPLNGENVFTYAGTNLPDYHSDLNAIHMAEFQLKGARQDENSELSQYINDLTFVCSDGLSPAEVWDWDLIHATAPQRCEAFLRTHGKWVDDQPNPKTP